MQKKFQILALSSLLICSLTACPIPVAPPTTSPTFTACSSSTPGLVGVQVGNSVEYTFQGLLIANFGTLPAGTAFAGKIRYPYPQLLNGATPNAAGNYVATFIDLNLGSDSVFSNSGKILVYDNSPITANGDAFGFTNDAYMSGYVGGLQLKPSVGMAVLLKGTNTIFSNTSLPGVGLQSTTFTNGVLELTDITGTTISSQLCP
jgi:hypothetical protein